MNISEIEKMERSLPCRLFEVLTQEIQSFHLPGVDFFEKCGVIGWYFFIQKVRRNVGGKDGRKTGNKGTSQTI